MANFYNKTYLNKIKKADLIEMFLHQQGGKNQLVMEVHRHEKLEKENEKLKEANDTFTLGAKRTIENNCKLYKENEKLKAENEKLKSHMIYMGHNKIKADLKKLKEENKKLQTQIDNLKGDVKFWSDKAEVIKRDHDQLDENYKLHKKSADIYEEKLIEEIEILRKKPNIENEKLKEENQNFKEILDEVREYLGRFDGDEVEVFDKIVKGE
jgi:outer membrane protein OmpA-like peptidoglycan-associated protein